MARATIDVGGTFTDVLILEDDVEERTLYSGGILTPLNADATRAAVETLRQAGVEAVAIMAWEITNQGAA